jgi:uncharacterized protein
MKNNVLIDLAANGCTDCVIGLLQLYDADVNEIDENGDTALIQAAAAGYKDTVLALLEYGADANIKNKQGMTAIKLAEMRGHEELVEVLFPYSEPQPY